VHGLYILSVFLHILAATVWIGGMFFVVLVFVPWLRGSASGRENAAVILRETGVRFRTIGWICFAILTITGTYQLYVRGVRFGDFADSAFLGSPGGRLIVAKLAIFGVVLVMSYVHDFHVGPKATAAIEADPRSAEAARLRAAASRFGRLNAMLALVIVALAVMIVRGSPF